MSQKRLPALLQAPVAQTAAASTPKLPADAWHEVEPSKVVGPAGVRAGKQGRPVMQTALFDLPTPADFMSMMRGLRTLDETALHRYAEFAELLEEIEPQYGSLLDARKKSTQRKQWFVESADDSKAAVEIADFVRASFGRGGWFRQFIYDALDAKGKGLAVLKKIPVLGPDGYGISHTQRIPLTWLMVDKNDGKTLLLRDANDPRKGIPLDPDNFIVHRATRKSGLSVRGGFAIPVGAIALGKISGWNWTLELLEQYGIPFRKAEYADGTPYEDVLGLQAAMEHMGRNGYIITKKGMSIDTVEGISRGGSAEAHKWFLEYGDKTIAKMIAGGTEASEAGGGSMAKAGAQLTIRDDIVDADALELEETIQSQLLEPLIRMRFGDKAPMPRFRFNLQKTVPLVDFMDGVEKFVGMGGKVQASAVRDRLQLEEPQADAELLMPSAGSAPAQPPAVAPNVASRTSQGRYLGSAARCSVHETAAAADDLDRIDLEVGAMLTEWEAVRRPLDAGLRQAMGEAGDPATRRERITAAVESLDIDGLVAQLLAARLKTRLAGELGGDL